MKESRRITAIDPRFGSKRGMAPEICRVLGPHRVYWEPFCGSMAVLLAKEPASMETVNDLHGDLINLARVVQLEDTAVELYSRLSRTLMAEKSFRELAAEWKAAGHQPATDTPNVGRAYRYFVCSWMGMNGVAGTTSFNQGFSARFTKNGGAPATRFRSAVESIPWWYERLRNVTILNRDAFALMAKIEDADGVVIYCDPPYLEKGAKYIHDFQSADHQLLADALSRFRSTRVVVSYYEHPHLEHLYPPGRWSKINCYKSKSLVSPSARDTTGKAPVAPEVLLVNQPDYFSMLSDSAEGS